MNLSQKSLANVCLFCGEGLNSPLMCTFCGFKFCEEHKSTENHQCIKTRYSEYIRKNQGANPNISNGDFKVVCEMCGFCSLIFSNIFTISSFNVYFLWIQIL